MIVKMIILSFISILWMVTYVKTDSGSCPDICLCLGPFVDCSNQFLHEIPKDLPSWVESLDMSSNQLHSNISEYISSFMLLNALKLNKNSLTSIPVQSILWNLTELNLAHNKIIEIGSEFMANLPNLKVLDLSNNYITKIRSEIFIKGSNLISLNLNNNKITHIEKGGLDGLVKLTDLKLNRNSLSRLDDVFSKMTNLKTLDLNRNRFTEIESLVFHKLDNLTVLRIRQNSIQHLQDGAFFGLHSLTSLHLDFNNISKVSKGWLYGLTSLHQLSLNHNRIRNLEGVWEQCKQLVDLELSNNELHTIEKNSFEYLSKLQRLRLNNNQISYIAEGAFNYTPSLKNLELNNNKISWTIEDMQGAFVGLQRLLLLDLSNNIITSISEKAFVGLNSLTNLDLSSNAINTIHKDALSAMPKLEVLSLNTSSLICDCGLGWFPLWLLQTRVVLDNIFCAYPNKLKGKPITKIQQEEFVCSPNDYPKPQITKDPVSQVALTGGNVTLSCYAKSSSDTKMNFKWKRNNQDIDIDDIFIEPDVIDKSVKTSVLRLSNVTLDHSAQYQCVVSNEFGTVYSRKAHLSVLVFPVLVKTPVNVTVKAGSTARLACSATGHPTPQIAWQKDGGNDFPAAQERRVHVMPMDDVLFIVNVKSADTGVYSCIAKNEAGVVVANATLTVLEPPSFLKKMEDKEVKIGSNVVLECMASGSPKPKLHWTKDGSYLQITNRHFFTAEDQLLIIMNTVVSDSGTYQCELGNSLGTNKGESHLTVLPLYDQRVNEEDLTGVIIITVVCCAVGTSAIWVIIIYQTRKRLNTPNTGLERIAKTKTFHLDTKSELSSSSKDSGTGDSTKRSHEDLLLGTVNCFHQFNEDNEAETTVPEVSLPLLTSFHPTPVIVPCCHTVARNCTPTTEMADTCKCQSGSSDKVTTQRTDHDRQHTNSYVCVYIPPPDS